MEAHDISVSLLNKKTFFIEPPLTPMNSFTGKSALMLIAAPGATGKSVLGYNLSIDKRALYWDLSKADIGDNYFIGTLSKSYGPERLGEVLRLVSNGDIAFVIDAFDEAEISSGWNRVQSFLKEICSYVNDKSKVKFVLLARHETAQYLSMILDELIGESAYYYYKIDFFERKKAKEFLLQYLVDKDVKYQTLKDKINSITEIVFDGIDNAMKNGSDEEGADMSFYGYAPVLQALAVLIMQYNNLQELENYYAQYTNYSRFIGQVIDNIITREKEKVVAALETRLRNKGLQTDNIKDLYSKDEQLIRLLNYTIEKKVNIDIQRPQNLKTSIIAEYDDLLKQFLPQHPFIMSSNDFASPAFKDFAIAQLLSGGKGEKYLMDKIEGFYSSITPLFWQFYLDNRQDKTIMGKHVGIMCESSISGKKSGDDSLSAVYDSAEGTKLTTILDFNTTEPGRALNYIVLPDPIDGIVFPFHMINTSIKSAIKVTCGYNSKEFDLNNSTVNASEIEFRCKNLIVRCDEMDKPVTIITTKPAIHSDLLKVEKKGNGHFSVCWPNGKKYPWAEYYLEKGSLEARTIDNLLLSLRQILKWFRKDRRDALARYADFINNVAVNGNDLNKRMLDYLLETHVIWQEGNLYKLAHKVAERNGINFTSIKNMKCNEQLDKYLSSFNK